MTRWILMAVVAAALVWGYRHRERFLPQPGPKAPAAETPLAEASREAAQAGSSGAGVTENMTADDVRRLLGTPDDVAAGSSETGKPVERWTYRAAGRVVVLEGGVVTRIERP
jgi:hypothetical protein